MENKKSLAQYNQFPHGSWTHCPLSKFLYNTSTWLFMTFIPVSLYLQHDLYEDDEELFCAFRCVGVSPHIPLSYTCRGSLHKSSLGSWYVLNMLWTCYEHDLSWFVMICRDLTWIQSNSHSLFFLHWIIVILKKKVNFRRSCKNFWRSCKISLCISSVIRVR